MLTKCASIAQSLAPNVDYWSIRILNEQSLGLKVRQDILQPLSQSFSSGIFIAIVDGNGMGYAATNDLTRSGLKTAFSEAQHSAKMTVDNNLINTNNVRYPNHSGQYVTPVQQAWESSSLSDKISLLHDASKTLKISDNIVDWSANLQRSVSEQLFVDSNNIRIEQELHFISPGLTAVANRGVHTQVRNGAGAETARQGGLEQLALLQFPTAAHQIADEALQLLDAPDCPNKHMDLLLTPSQMMLQIHESIGHPLELDRILGDERNYAGTSFVKLDMFGHYRYGSDLLNITFNPNISEELASYAFDDDGFRAKQEYLIRDGILQKPLGSHLSQQRANCSGVVANARASSWNRPTIDRMANLNLEPGAHDLSELIASIEDGVLMDSNRSWSIDDSRNKFQFGCEYGQLIKNGELKQPVRNPNYRGISATFWQNLRMVGNKNSVGIFGTPNCGKGEPNQLIQVGHASPACVFSNVDIFGGA